MILLDNFQKVEDWPTNGFLYGSELLEQDVFDQLLNFNFEVVGLTDPTFPNRKALTSENAGTIDASLGNLLDRLRVYANNFEVIRPLIEKSLQGSDMHIYKFWAHGLDSIKDLQKSVFIQFVEDKPGLFLAPHVDHREVLCNMQIYISPNEPSIGTRFYKTDDYSISKIAPFVPNCGYFSFNTHMSVHGVQNTSNWLRRSIIISWTM